MTTHLPRRRTAQALATLLILLGLFGLSLADAAWRSRTATRPPALVQELGLSDLALFTEARYTRHPTQADRQTPFQDHPAALEHFPTGSLLPPPQPPSADPHLP